MFTLHARMWESPQHIVRRKGDKIVKHLHIGVGDKEPKVQEKSSAGLTGNSSENAPSHVSKVCSVICPPQGLHPIPQLARLTWMYTFICGLLTRKSCLLPQFHNKN